MKGLFSQPRNKSKASEIDLEKLGIHLGSKLERQEQAPQQEIGSSVGSPELERAQRLRPSTEHTERGADQPQRLAEPGIELRAPSNPALCPPIVQDLEVKAQNTPG